MTSPLIAVKTLTIKSWAHNCTECHETFDIEEAAARLAPDAPLYVVPDEPPYAALDRRGRVICPHCKNSALVKLAKSRNKKIELSLLVHPSWSAGESKVDASGAQYGGSAQDDAASTASWNDARGRSNQLLEVRGVFSDTVICPATNVSFNSGKAGGTVPKKSHYACGSCGTVQDVLATVRASRKTGPLAGYAVQGFSEKSKTDGSPYNGRFFAPFDAKVASQYNAALFEWEARKDSDLANYWPRSEVPFGFMTALNNGDIREGHGFTHWWMMFNPRQLLVHAQLLKAITTTGTYSWGVREYVMGAFQQYLRNQSLFTLWNLKADKLEPMFANNNYHPKSTVVENSVFTSIGRGNWQSCAEGIVHGREWAMDPWDTVSVEALNRVKPDLAAECAGKGAKVKPMDSIGAVSIYQRSSTELTNYDAESIDLVITDPPFGGLLHYSELADFFYVWLRLTLKERYPENFGPQLTPKAMEAVANRAREPGDPDGFYQRILTQCWREAHRILRPGGILAFTFHHSEDAPWVSVLESLFNAGFYLEAAYPIRSDETKGEGGKPGTFGSQLIEYDIIHVCRKRIEEPTAVSWGRMRREVLADVRQLQAMLENHAKEGLPSADLQVIRRGKALEYFSRHYGKVFVDEGRAMSVKDALVGINQLIDEDASNTKDPPPVVAEPISRQFLRIFDGKSELARDQMQKLLRGSGIAPDEFSNRGWVSEQMKVFHLVNPLDFARDWQGRHRRRLTADLDQALVLVGACYDGSGINASDTLNNGNFRPHPALKALLEWLSTQGSNRARLNAASRALSIYNNWAENNRDVVNQLSLFVDDR